MSIISGAAWTSAQLKQGFGANAGILTKPIPLGMYVRTYIRTYTCT